MMATLRKNQTILVEGQGSFVIVQMLGRGATSYVCKCRWIDQNRDVALKIMKKGSDECFFRETAILSKISHPNIIEILFTSDSFMYQNTVVPCKIMALEYHTGNTLAELIEKFRLPLPLVKKLFKEMVEGIDYLHCHGFSHRDIKLDNLYVCSKSKSLKILDFGLAEPMGSDDTVRQYSGTPAYTAPEMWQRDRFESLSGRAVDIWSIGVILYCMLSGNHPFSSPSRQVLIEQILHSNPTINSLGHYDVPVEWMQLLDGMLQKDPANRITTKAILSHDFFRPIVPTKKRDDTAVQVSKPPIHDPSNDKEWDADTPMTNLCNIMLDMAWNVYSFLDCRRYLP
eukprot:TRINITY_DN463_c0_g3_i1.p1 TRINITY_DN463_c0_g3~~TRINITY_DN463_c0_g3_i1.p1  ORF type:complete len:341 (-),score=62.52 TRINITY_DN463_c0_g3_i1:167-1189(-)